MSSAKVWLITGTSSGLGKSLVLKVLAKGDRVVASSRDPNRLESLKAKGAATIRLDHNEPLEQIKAAVAAAVVIYGRIDIVVNNAGYVQLGTLEETSPEETLQQFQANVFGPLNVYRAVLPYLRKQHSGVLATIGSMGAWYSDAGANLYHSSKATIRLIAQGLQAETSALGIKHCLIEPGCFRTELLSQTANHLKINSDHSIDDYAEINKAVGAGLDHLHGKQIGDPEKAVAVIYDVLTSSGVAQGREIPTTLALGGDAVMEITKSAQRVIDIVKDWEKISSSTDFPEGR